VNVSRVTFPSWPQSVHGGHIRFAPHAGQRIVSLADGNSGDVGASSSYGGSGLIAHCRPGQ